MIAHPRSRSPIWSIYRCDRRPQAKIAERAEHLHIIVKAIFPERVPSDFASRILTNQPLLFGVGHVADHVFRRHIVTHPAQFHIAKTFRNIHSVSASSK